MEVFEACSHINDLLLLGNESDARSELIRLLDFHRKEDIPYTPLLNTLIRNAGLYPYLDPESSAWQDRFVHESFKVDIGEQLPVTLHSEQSLVLKALLNGESIAVSAPTSFGKSLIIDAFIALRRPQNILIIVPTIALTDETRRRLSRKFGREYKVITTPDIDLSERNILIFPQERAIHYCEKIQSLDLFVVDEFYKASQEFDKERAPSLLKAMLKLGAISKQRYYLAPNITSLNLNPFTEGMRFLPLDFHTVFLDKHDLFKEIKKDAAKKSQVLLEILGKGEAKSLIYAGNYSNVDIVATLLLVNTPTVKKALLEEFSAWLGENYDPNWKLTGLVTRGTGIHTGQLHRSLSQIQVKLFEEDNGLTNLISTSSIIEGVNTCAENVIVWSNKIGRLLLNDFTFRNIIGRGGRMFRHFVGNIFILEQPPEPKDTQLALTFPDELLADVDEAKFKRELTREQLAKIIHYREEMSDIVGKDILAKIQSEGLLMTGDMALILDIVKEIHANQKHWRGLKFLNFPDIDNWGWILHKVLKLMPARWDVPHTKFVEFVKILSMNWERSTPEILEQLNPLDLGIEQFFKLEKSATFKLAALLSDVNVLQKEILVDEGIDIAPFIAQLSRAFLPSCVFELEEYGLPRMISKKIHAAGVIDFLREDLGLHEAIKELNDNRAAVFNSTAGIGVFDRYVLNHFYDGIGQR